MGFRRRRFAVLASTVSLALIAAGCGGGGSSTPPATYAISGTVSGAVASGVTVALSGAATSTATTDSTGHYSFSGLANGSYTVTPSLAGYSFAPTSRTVTVSGANATGQDFTSSALPTYSISGAVSGAVLQGVTVTLGGAASRTTTTDAGGAYVFTGLLDGAYTVTPSLSGYAFNPVSRAATVSGANVTGLDFAASTSTGGTHSISGTVSGAVTSGVTLALTAGPVGGSVVSGASGSYTITGLPDGTYTVTPSLAGYSFAPTSLSVTVAGADVTGQSFTSTALTYSVSGHVTGLGSTSATVTLGGAASATTTTDSGGMFTFTGLTNGSYTVTPTAAGYTFTPASRSVTVTGGDVSGVDFTAALAAVYTVSGTVSGSVASGVTVTLSGTASATTTTNGAGTYSFGSLTNGSYTVTPSLSHYAFTPASRTVTVSGASVGAQNFTSSPASTYTLSGAVTGPWVEGVTVSLGGDASATATTNASGAYSFQGLYAGSYTVAPSLPGYGYSPSGPTVTITAADATQNFTAASAVASYSVSGTVSYGGTKTGRIYVGVYPQSCGGCSPVAGTSISAPGAYTVRGLGNGSYDLKAFRDVVGVGLENANDPTSGTSTVTVSSADVSGANLALTDPAGISPQPPTGVGVFPGNGGAAVFWDKVKNANGVETATAYKVYWGTDTNASTGGGSVTVAAGDNEVGLQSASNGAVYYYKVTSLVGTTESAPSAVYGPVTIGAIAGPNVLTGTVTFPGTATGPLYVGVFDQTAGVMRNQRIANPTSPQAFSIGGIPSGSSYFPFAIIDMNNDGAIDAGDLSNTGSGGSANISITGATTHDIALSGANATAGVTTQHQIQQGVSGSDWYNVDARVNGLVKVPVAVILYSGPNVAVPVDVGRQWEFDYYAGTGSTRPGLGDTYRLKVTYSDGSTELLSASVTTVLDSFATSLTVNTGSPYSQAVPLFTWVAPASPPASYTYRVSLYGPGASWWYPQNDGLPAGTTSAQYNADGNAMPSSLASSTTYNWSVIVQDAAGNQASAQTTYSY
jgi:hypothetical protein